MKAPVRSFAALLFILISFQARPAAAQSAVTVINNGPVANRVDLVILGDGYTAAELNKYATDVQGVINGFFQQEPFREYQRYFNVHRIDVVSNESGADHPELTPPILRDTALDGAYNCAGIQRLICVNTTKVQTIASALLSPAARDIILVIVNDTVYGGSGGAVGVASIHPSAIELVLHELGHSFGLLTDEYGGPPPPACVPSIEPQAANATMQTERALIKWNPWIDAATPIPTPGTAPGVPGLYLGAAYCDMDLFRPTFNSKMRSLGRPYEQINAEQLIRRIYNLVAPIEAVQPAESTISLERGERREFSAVTPLPLTQPLDLAWLVDGVAQGSGPSFSLDSTTLAPGDHTIELIARDLTPMVRQDPAQLLVDRRSWRVSVRDPSLRLLRAIPASAVPGAKAEISVELAAQGDEHRLSFSLNFDPSILTAPQASLGADAASATLITDATQVAQGRFGVSLTLPEGQVFAAGARRVVIVNLTVAAGAGATKTLVGFGDQPVAQAVFGLNGPALGASYAPGVVAINSRTVQGASAASYSVAGMPAASIASVFGVALADGTESAQDFPLPTTLAGATVRITDSLNVERLAPLFFASPGQINFLVPPETSPGTAIVTVTAHGETAVGVLPVTETNAGLFAANADGAGAASGYVVRLKADGTRSEESISRFDFVSQKLVPRPINLGPETDQLILVLFGTGLRHHRTPVRASIGGIEAEVLYAGPQGEFLGLDQINLRLSRRLSRRGEVDVLMVVDGQPANILKINVF